MTFAHPWMLLLLLPAAAMAWLRYRRNARAAVRFSQADAVATIPPGWAVRFERILPILYLAGVGLLVVALARPQRGIDEATSKTEVVDIALLLDLSTSMRAPDMVLGRERMDRLEAAKRVVGRFIENRSGDRMAIVAFAAMPFTISPMTMDTQWLNENIQRLQTGMLVDGTAIGSAIASGVNRLKDSEAKSKVMILLTDGVNNAGSVTPENAAQLAQAMGIRIHTIGIGGGDMPTGRFPGTLMRPTAEFDEASLRQIAEITGGQYFAAQNVEALQRVYDEIDAMERTEIDVQRYRRYEELFAGFLLPALFLLGLEKLLASTWLRRLP